MNYYKRHIGDYAAKAGHLTPLEHGVYSLILDAYYNREEAPTRAEAMRWARARSKDEVAAVEVVLSEFFNEADGRFMQPRVEEELSAFRSRQETNRQLGARGGQAKRKRIATESLSETEANDKPSHKPLAISQEEAKAKSCASSRGSRLPDGWELPEDWRQWACAERPDVSAEQEGAKFADFWHGKAGAAGRKADWQATWRNWIRNAHPSRASPGSVIPIRPSAAENFRGKTYAGTPIDDLPPDLRDAARAALAGDG